jgi:hypothetical protein
MDYNTSSCHARQLYVKSVSCGCAHGLSYHTPLLLRKDIQENMWHMADVAGLLQGHQARQSAFGRFWPHEAVRFWAVQACGRRGVTPSPRGRGRGEQPWPGPNRRVQPGAADCRKPGGCMAKKSEETGDGPVCHPPRIRPKKAEAHVIRLILVKVRLSVVFDVE